MMSDLILNQTPTPAPALTRLAVVEYILRDRTSFFAEVRQSIDLREKIVAMLLSSFVFLAIYGGVMGASHTMPQVFSSALKLPVLFLITLIICAPSLYFFNILFGSQQSILQNLALILTAFTVTSVLLVSLAPVTLFFLTTTSDYPFFKLLNVAIFGVAGIMGLGFLRQGFEQSVDADNPVGRNTRRTLFLLWIILYAFVGTQMAWTLSPFIGDPQQPFIIFRQVGGNFYVDVIDSLFSLLAGL